MILLVDKHDNQELEYYIVTYGKSWVVLGQGLDSPSFHDLLDRRLEDGGEGATPRGVLPWVPLHFITRRLDNESA